MLSTAGEGGPWGMALLASYMVHKKGETLEEYLNAEVFDGENIYEMQPDSSAAEGFKVYLDRYKAGLAIEEAAARCL